MPVRVPATVLERQLTAIFRGWGMAEQSLGPTVRVMLETDLRGIDSHGLAMLPMYDQLRQEGRLEMKPQIRVVRDGPATAVIDAGGGLGHAPGVKAMTLAVQKARATGVACVTVRNSNHYGAAGAYALMAAREGMVGMTTTNCLTPAIVPTRARSPFFGTNPIAFAAPGRRNPPLVLDMATSTVAVGKLKLKWLAGEDLPAGWVVDEKGEAVSDAFEAFGRLGKVAPGIGLTPLGGLAETASHKGYGLAAMVETLSAMLGGATFIGTRLEQGGPDGRNDIGHFFLALDPGAFRDDRDAFAREMDVMIDRLHAAAPNDPAEPVLVPGDPESRAYGSRERDGVPVPDKVARQVAEICRGCGAPYLLDEEAEEVAAL